VITTLALIGIVIVVASLMSSFLDRSGVPLAVAFLALGAALGPWGLNRVDVTLDSTTLRALATLALALVLFTDAVTLETTEVRTQRSLAWRLLVPGTLLPAALTTFAAWWLLDLSWPAATILGAALASTDPVILRSLLRSPALPSTTRMALRLETGMNDVVLVPVLVIAMLLAGGGGEAGESGEMAAELRRSLLGLFLLGPALGAAVGWIGIAALVRVRTRLGVRRDYESLYALGLALTAFAAAETAGGSGFLAAFTAGLMVAAQDVELCDCFLEYGEATAEMMMLLTFVAFGTSLIWSGLMVLDASTLAVAVVALAGRTLVLYPMLTGAGVSERDRRLIALLGPRGLSALLLVLLPVFEGMPGAERLFSVTCLAVLLSMVLHGGGIAVLMRGARSGARAAVPPTPSPPTSGRGSNPPGQQPVAAGSSAATARARSTLPSLRHFPAAVESDPSDDDVRRISVEETRQMLDRGEPVVLVDVRAERSYRADPLQATRAVRLPPDDPVRAAEAGGLPRDATLALYCA
jgi:NhaP-type Na+/H+ or K+/H+ antiporter